MRLAGAATREGAGAGAGEGAGAGAVESTVEGVRSGGSEPIPRISFMSDLSASSVGVKYCMLRVLVGVVGVVDEDC